MGNTLEVLLAAERAALLAGRDDEFTMLATIAYTGMRWGETIGLIPPNTATAPIPCVG